MSWKAFSLLFVIIVIIIITIIIIKLQHEDAALMHSSSVEARG